MTAPPRSKQRGRGMKKTPNRRCIDPPPRVSIHPACLENYTEDHYIARASGSLFKSPLERCGRGSCDRGGAGASGSPRTPAPLLFLGDQVFPCICPSWCSQGQISSSSWIACPQVAPG